MRRNRHHSSVEKGAALLLVTISIFVIMGMAGFAIDAGHMYAVKQRAQAAADAGAQAGVMDMYRGVGDGSTSAHAYAEKHGFAASEINVTYPTCSSLSWCNGHVTLSTTDSPNLIQVTITRSVNTTFMRALGVNASTVTAVASAAISLEPQPIPILVLHPTQAQSFRKYGTNTIQICGGPPRSIQVNSVSVASVDIDGASGVVDLRHAGPLDAGNCVAGTGGDFANVGLESWPAPATTLLLGTKPGQYISPASPIEDPLLSVAEPSVQPGPPQAPVNANTAALRTAHNCPTDCTIISPGYYDGTTHRLDNLSGFVVMRPGIYWINHNGFQLGSGTIVRMASAAADMSDPVTGTTWTNEVLIYNNPQAPVNSTKDIFAITASSGKMPGNNTYPTDDCSTGGNCFNGTPTSSAFKGILFFQSRTTRATLNHYLRGGGGLTLKGTIYMTHTAAAIQADGTYQWLQLEGTSGGTTKVLGEIIVDRLWLGGTSGITMNLNSPPVFDVRQVALVQ